ncbi:MAG: adaptor protein MecA [Clostridia bacterium]|nr:adaptor protein MecA [Clostridia bacterium]
MELLKISENALKVSLSREDMEFYDIEFDALDYSNTETRRVIWSILDEAKRTLGFEAVRDKLYIKAFRSRCGGCELFVTRDEKEQIECAALFRFSDVDLLARACARLKNCLFSGESRLFLGDDEKFYLYLSGEGGFMFLCEVAQKVKLCEEFLAEHARLLFDGAVEKMAVLV